jgi:hypothetical protein
VFEMATSLIIEEESGTYTAALFRHRHNGYYAGDFSRAARPIERPAPDAGHVTAVRVLARPQ